VNYDFIKKLGEGHFGDVWLVNDLDTGRHSALKLLKPERLRRPIDEIHGEARALVEAEHDHVVRVYNAGLLDDGSPTSPWSTWSGAVWRIGTTTAQHRCGKRWMS
jgi:serine/threonine protein kinase